MALPRGWHTGLDGSVSRTHSDEAACQWCDLAASPWATKTAASVARLSTRTAVGVPAATQRAATLAAELAARELRLPRVPQVKFFAAGPGDPRGLADPHQLREVWMDSALSALDVIETTAHELRHLALDYQPGGPPAEAEGERLADAFGKDFAAEWAEAKSLLDGPLDALTARAAAGFDGVLLGLARASVGG